MKISVVIPVFNESSYIKKCLESLKNQKEPADEIIIVDNNCTDDTIKIAKKFKVKIIKEKKQGIIQARNTGFNYVKNEIIARCDADSIVPSDWIRKIKKFFKNNKNADALTGPVCFYDVIFINKTVIPFLIYNYASRLILGHNILAGPNMIITKKIWEKIKNEVCQNNFLVHEDVDLAIHINKYSQISLDSSLVVKISGRRIKNKPFSFFIEYPLRLLKTLIIHNKWKKSLKSYQLY